MVSNLFLYNQKISPLHKVNTKLKLFLLFVICFLNFYNASSINLTSIILSSISFVICLIFFILSNHNFKSIKNVRFVFFIGLFVTLFSSLSFSFFEESFEIISRTKILDGSTKSFAGNTKIFDGCVKIIDGTNNNPSSTNKIFDYLIFDFILFSKNGLIYGANYTYRFFICALFCQLVFETTSSLQIKDAIEDIENKISKIIPSFEKLHLSLIISTTICFIPEIIDLWNKIDKASLMRLGKNQYKFKNFVYVIVKKFECLLSMLLYKAEVKRKAMINRSEEI